MSENRREFLRHSLVVLGSTITGASTRALGETAPSSCCGGSCGTLALSATGTVGASAAHTAEQEASARVGMPGRKWVMVIDLAKCDGCGHCTQACSKMHFVPPDRQWIKVLKMQEAEATAPYFFPQPCYHCDNPPCTKVCPVDATFKRQDGVVLIDNDRCIGCRFCMAACPYGARSFNWDIRRTRLRRWRNRIRLSMGLRAESALSKSATSAPTWRRRGSSPPAPPAAPWARSTTAMKTRMRSQIVKARPPG